jgi:hypothetical protein
MNSRAPTLFLKKMLPVQRENERAVGPVLRPCEKGVGLLHISFLLGFGLLQTCTPPPHPLLRRPLILHIHFQR